MCVCHVALHALRATRQKLDQGITRSAEDIQTLFQFTKHPTQGTVRRSR